MPAFNNAYPPTNRTTKGGAMMVAGPPGGCGDEVRPEDWIET
jgi:hypothetical protein